MEYGISTQNTYPELVHHPYDVAALDSWIGLVSRLLRRLWQSSSRSERMVRDQGWILRFMYLYTC